LAPPIQLQLFGYPALSAGDEPLTGTVAQRHRLALLALLAVAPRRTMPREKLFAVLWPEADTASARHLLNTCVHAIRRGLTDDVLVTRREDVSLSHSVDVDVRRFQDLVTDGQLERAVSLYRAPFLDAFFLDGAVEFEEWTSKERSRLASLFRDALESLATRAESSGDAGAAVTWWRTLNREDPYNTRVVTRLMLALERVGDHGNAIELALEHQSLLARDVEAEPPVEFRTLVQRMRDHPNGLAEPSRADDRQQAHASPSLSPANAVGDAHVSPVPVSTVASTIDTHPTRRRRIRMLAATGAVSAVAVSAFLTLRPSPFSSSTILIGPFENLTGDTAFNAVGSELRDLVIRDASQWSRVQVVLSETTNASASLLPGLVRRERAGTLIEGSYGRTADSIRFEGRVIDRRNNQVRRVIRVGLPARDVPSAAMQAFSERVMGALAMVVDDQFAAVATADHAAPTFQAYQEFAVGLELHGNAEHDQAIDRFRRAAAADSTFTLAMVWLGRALDKGARFRAADSLARALRERTLPLPDADRFAVDWLQARYRGDVQSAYRAARALAALTPGSPWAITYASEAATLRRPNEAHQILVELQDRSPWIVHWSEFVTSLSYSLHLLGRYEEEYALARRNRPTATNLIVRLIAEARPLAAMGRAGDIDLLVNEALATAEQPNLNEGSLMQRIGTELRAHGHVEAARTLFNRSRSWYEAELREEERPAMYGWALGNTLRNLGEVDSAKSAYMALHRRIPGMYRFHGELAVVAAMTRNVSEFAHFDSLLARPESNWNNFDASLRIWYRARAAALLGERAEALQLLQTAVARGVPVDLDSIHIDPDFHTLRGLPAFDELTRLRR
jgi:DNA-binding SARP family transcriptional activator/TolB-like protein